MNWRISESQRITHFSLLDGDRRSPSLLKEYTFTDRPTDWGSFTSCVRPKEGRLRSETLRTGNREVNHKDHYLCVSCSPRSSSPCKFLFFFLIDIGPTPNILIHIKDLDLIMNKVHRSYTFYLFIIYYTVLFLLVLKKRFPRISTSYDEIN